MLGYTKGQFLTNNTRKLKQLGTTSEVYVYYYFLNLNSLPLYSIFFLPTLDSPTTKYVSSCILRVPAKLASALRSQQTASPPTLPYPGRELQATLILWSMHVGSEPKDCGSPRLGVSWGEAS